jgi:hypothetical protein
MKITPFGNLRGKRGRRRRKGARFDVVKLGNTMTGKEERV